MVQDFLCKEDIEGEALATLVVNKIRGTLCSAECDLNRQPAADY